MNIQPTAQDIARGGGNIPTGTTSRKTSPSKSKTSSTVSDANMAFARSR